MPRAKKDISKDLMFQKIMPSADLSPKHDLTANTAQRIVDEEDEIDNESSNEINDEIIDKIINDEPTKVYKPELEQKPLRKAIKPTHLNLPAIPPKGVITPSRKMAARTVAFSSDMDSEGYLINTMEKLVFDNLEGVLARFKCCKCDRCKKDILALTLNTLPPKYVVATKNEPPKFCHDVQEINDVTTALVRAVIKVKSEPRH